MSTTFTPRQNLHARALNNDVRRDRDRRAIRHQLMWLVCACLLAASFVYAAGQHFAAVRYGYQSELLRREQDRLIEEQRQLTLKLEAASSPARLEQAARALGLNAVKPQQLFLARGTTITTSTTRKDIP